MISTKGRYAIRVMIDLAEHDEGKYIPLKDIAADLERSFGTQIVVADAKVASQRFLAFFTNGEDLDEILSLLSRNGDLRVVRSDGTVYLYGKK